MTTSVGLLGMRGSTYRVSLRLQKGYKSILSTMAGRATQGAGPAKHTVIAAPLQVPPPLGPITALPPKKRQGTWASSAPISQPTAARPPQSGQASRALSAPLGVSGPCLSMSNPGGHLLFRPEWSGGWGQRPALGQLRCVCNTSHTGNQRSQVDGGAGGALQPPSFLTP